MFKVIKVSSWSDAWTLGRSLDDIFIFRGTSKSSYRLTPSLERSISQACTDGTVANLFDFGDLLRDREKLILTQFKRRAHHYLTNPPLENSNIEWLALIQHYGGPTRLLDATHSFAVAAFFSVENSSEDAAVWAFNNYSLKEAIGGRTNISYTNRRLSELLHSDFLQLAEDFIRGEASGRLVLPIEPLRMNERLSIQQGLFLFPCDPHMSFEKNLADTINIDVAQLNDTKPTEYSQKDLTAKILSKYKLLKIILPTKLQYRARQELWKMNINAATLFKGLDGFARSLNYYVKFE